MNKCHVLKELSAYLDNQLKDDEKLMVQEHLKSCNICSRELGRLKALSEKLKAWQIAELDASFDSSVKNRIVAQELERGAEKMNRKTLAIWVPSGVLAAILLFVFVGQYMTHGVQGRLRESSDGIGEVLKSGSRVNTKNYEPYYLSADRAGVGSGEGSVIVIQPILPATGEGEKIIRSAQVRLEVEDGKTAYSKASAICQELGGYLAASNFYKDAEGRESGTITMRIPKDKFTAALDKLGNLGKVEDSNSNSQDVSQEYANLKARLDASMVVYNKMLEALQKRQVTIPEAMRLESELTPVLRKIEDLKNQIESLNNAVSFTTITLTFHEPTVSAKVLKESKHYIQQSMLLIAINAIKFVAQAVPAVIAIVIWLAIFIALAFLLKYWLKRLFKRE